MRQAQAYAPIASASQVKYGEANCNAPVFVVNIVVFLYSDSEETA